MHPPARLHCSMPGYGLAARQRYDQRPPLASDCVVLRPPARLHCSIPGYGIAARRRVAARRAVRRRRQRYDRRPPPLRTVLFCVRRLDCIAVYPDMAWPHGTVPRRTEPCGAVCRRYNQRPPAPATMLTPAAPRRALILRMLVGYAAIQYSHHPRSDRGGNAWKEECLCRHG
jgi:hypothetical protein